MLSNWIDSGEVWPFMKVAVMTRERQICRSARAPMLPRDNVFEMETIEGFIILMNMAILTSIARALLNEVAQLG